MRSSKNDGGAHALSLVVEEARRLPAPELDWNALEMNLEHALEQPAPRLDQRQRSRAFAWALVPAAAALMTLAALFVPRAEPAQPKLALREHVEPVQDGDSLSAEERIVADTKAVEVVHSGRARWTLEPNSRAVVLEHGEVVRVRLLAGALKASVVKSSQPERFVVEAAGTRVAVHGTRFRVALKGERTLVDVEQGVVSVGPRERPAQPTAMLSAPTHGEFTLEGSSILPGGPAQAASQRLRVARPVRHVSSTPSAEPAEPAAAPEASVSHSLTIGEAEAGVAIAVAAITRCFKEHTEGSHDVRVSAETELTLDVSEAGVVTSVDFGPPLSPAVQSCAKRETLAVRFAPSTEGARITRALELTR